jgi:hypothetical protein
MRQLMRFRASLALCWFVSLSVLLAAGAGTGAAAAGHHHKDKSHRPNQNAVLPKTGPLPAPSLFGINTGTYDKSHADFDRDVPTAHSIGARWVHFTGAGVGFRDGQPVWNTLNFQVKQARKAGMGVLISLGGTPRACSLASGRRYPESCPPTTSGDLAAYQKFLRGELLHFHNDVQYWESWLEPNGPTWWGGQANPQQYANLLVAEYRVFQAFNAKYHTDLKLLFAGPISFGTAPGSRGAIAVLPFVHDVLGDLHGARAFDGIGLHAYRFPQQDSGPPSENWGPTMLAYDYVGGIPNAPGARGPYPSDGCGQTYGGFCQMTWPEELSAYEQEFANDGYPNMPLWLTEFGWPGTASPTTALYPSFATQATYLTEAYNDLLRLPFVQAAFWFNLRDYQPGVVSPDPLFFYNYGLLRYGYGPKPAATAWEALARANPGR